MAIRSEEVIKAEIARLREMKPRIRRMSAFNDDNHKAIDAQLATMERGLNYDTIYDQGWNQHSESAASDAVAWLVDDEDDSPSDSWSGLAK